LQKKTKKQVGRFEQVVKERKKKLLSLSARRKRKRLPKTEAAAAGS
jgi:hypothetical protein